MPLLQHLFPFFGREPRPEEVAFSPQYNGKRFVNPVPTSSLQPVQIPNVIKRQLQNGAVKSPNADYLFGETGQERLQDGAAFHVNWLGHASVLIHRQGKYYLTDPVLSERASPFRWLGPKRFFPSPIHPERLPDLEMVILSHDHYDHFDYPTLSRLHPRVKRFVVPLGVGASLRAWGVPHEKIAELDWWDTFQTEGLTLTAAPARHFSGRLFSRDNTLWCSWSLDFGDCRLYYGGDSGIFPGFQEIGERCGPFEWALIPIGAYDEAWHDIHLDPEEGYEAFQMVRARQMIPIHWGTFQLAMHSWYEPIERLEAIAPTEVLLTPAPGEWISPQYGPARPDWWRRFLPR
ncbi:L-ascorbate metabolism protein UlaG, beta-lactamase superfamily [Catalinimonas alkaloidigena]|uniref:L-ascorbate metabolism protein UlaG, beta-lactamase superfamily n=1 Tax=Catalinimonas alkaloidigena TaxID=1075417 RepID=A0A1G9QD16_9BACT|nr:MBL fold metallo-hydrolase [Catalinimonas alkaloidigena]SDM08843.1 L-ascorbate metabolism protein UlaG, beta-lactamase superfamily [Catalinimonas alkaloidigena]